MRLFRFLFVAFSLFSSVSSFADCVIDTQRVEVEGGVIHYQQSGSGPAILLLHGLFASKEQWQPLLCLLGAAGYNAIAPDLPGYGASVDFPISAYQLEQQVNLLQKLINQLRLGAVDIAGNSMGGALAALYLRNYPQQVRTLAFIGAPLGITPWHKPLRDAINQGINPFIPVNEAELDLEMRLLFVQPPQLPPAVQQRLLKEYTERNRHYQQVWNIVSLYNTLLEPPALWLQAPAPTLILWGAQDQIFAVAAAPKLRQRFPRGQLMILANAGHLPQLENVEEVADIYLEFLRIYPVRRKNPSFRAGM